MQNTESWNEFSNMRVAKCKLQKYKNEMATNMSLTAQFQPRKYENTKKIWGSQMQNTKEKFSNIRFRECRIQNPEMNSQIWGGTEDMLNTEIQKWNGHKYEAHRCKIQMARAGRDRITILHRATIHPFESGKTIRGELSKKKLVLWMFEQMAKQQYRHSGKFWRKTGHSFIKTFFVSPSHYWSYDLDLKTGIFALPTCWPS